MHQENRDWELVLNVGADGGSVALYGRETGSGWVFRRHVADQTPMLIDEESIDHDSDPVSTWAAAVRLLDRYPWCNLFPTMVHPDFHDRVWREISKRVAKGRVTDDSLDRWVEACRPPESAP